MLLLLKLIILCSIWCLGIKILTSDGMLLGAVGKFGEKKVAGGGKIYEPLWVCIWCMPSIHSLIAYFFGFCIGIINHFEWRLILIYPILAMGTSFVAGVLWTAYETISQIHLYFKNLNESK